ncbi:MAG: hypothetical protein DRJ35_08335 [Thermoprotei archaeon]|nr:MAG: hypothetical protein DRJ35_08335 [Thermoprotei archaeon]
MLEYKQDLFGEKTPEIRRLIEDLVDRAGDVVSNTFIPLVLFDRYETMKHLEQMKKDINELERLI